MLALVTLIFIIFAKIMLGFGERNGKIRMIEWAVYVWIGEIKKKY